MIERTIHMFREEFVEQVRKLCELGALDYDIVEFFGIDHATLREWRLKYPTFSQAMKIGYEFTTDQVERAIYSRAVGFSVPEEKIFCSDGMVTRVQTTKHSPPETKAAVFWLINKRSADWKDVKLIETQRKNVTREQLIAQLAELHDRTNKRHEPAGEGPGLNAIAPDQSKH